MSRVKKRVPVRSIMNAGGGILAVDADSRFAAIAASETHHLFLLRELHQDTVS